MDSETTLHELKEKVKTFCEDREWDQYHNPKELAIGVITEASELLEKFRFKTEKQMEELLEEKKEEIADEMADVLFFIIRFAQKHDVDLAKEFDRKLEKNKEKYPVEKSKGRNDKYTDYEK